MLHQQHTTTATMIEARETRRLGLVPDLSRVFKINGSHMAETLKFLAERPVHTVVMTSFLQDNGFDQELNRGTFYGYRNAEGRLEGVALIGHSTLFEARTETAIEAFAFVARTSEIPLHLVMSSGDAADRFWSSYRGGASSPRLRCEEVLFQAAFPYSVQKCEKSVEPASVEYLIQIAEAQAEVAFAESGVDPMVRDRKGFLKRVKRRIDQGRVFAVVENGKLVFKADIIAETSDVIYLEGIYVAPEYRGNGIGARCLSALVLQLLSRSEHICLLSNVDFADAHKSFVKAGFRAADKCVSLFV
ncbi:MAG: GNAT family N-acetyltransferase [Pyrinomonadaceae bacterium]|nr:GNAT family N-acetyltransferase [Pyrinomonadaceae bacterium]MBP6213897.1 GNAT family N-acetyltransferase [Pyrinomonadaceae bacterium]